MAEVEASKIEQEGENVECEKSAGGWAVPCAAARAALLAHSYKDLLVHFPDLQGYQARGSVTRGK